LTKVATQAVTPATAPATAEVNPPTTKLVAAAAPLAIPLRALRYQGRLSSGVGVYPLQLIICTDCRYYNLFVEKNGSNTSPKSLYLIEK
jgi:hypothetical protein